MGDLRADLVAALREEALDLGCAGLPELDRIGDALERIARRVERAGSHVHPHFMTHPLTGKPWCQCPCDECQGHVEGREGDDCLCPGCTCGDVGDGA